MDTDVNQSSLPSLKTNKMVKNIIIVCLLATTITNKVAHEIYKSNRAIMNQETINTLESMYFWMEEDMDSDRIDGEIGQIYLANIEGSIIDLRN